MYKRQIWFNFTNLLNFPLFLRPHLSTCFILLLTTYFPLSEAMNIMGWFVQHHPTMSLNSDCITENIMISCLLENFKEHCSMWCILCRWCQWQNGLCLWYPVLDAKNFSGTDANPYINMSLLFTWILTGN